MTYVDPSDAAADSVITGYSQEQVALHDFGKTLATMLVTGSGQSVQRPSMKGGIGTGYVQMWPPEPGVQAFIKPQTARQIAAVLVRSIIDYDKAMAFGGVRPRTLAELELEVLTLLRKTLNNNDDPAACSRDFEASVAAGGGLLDTPPVESLQSGWCKATARLNYVSKGAAPRGCKVGFTCLLNQQGQPIRAVPPAPSPPPPPYKDPDAISNVLRQTRVEPAPTPSKKPLPARVVAKVPGMGVAGAIGAVLLVGALGAIGYKVYKARKKRRS